MSIDPEHILQVFLEGTASHKQAALNLGIVSVIMFFVAAWLWVFFARRATGFRITSLFWMTCAVTVRMSLFLPIEFVLPAAQAALAVGSLLFVMVPVILARRRYLRAWPDHLDWLAQKPPLAPALGSSIIVVAIVVLFIGLCYLPRWFTCITVGIQAGALLGVAHLRYSPEAALAGMVMVSLAVISALLAITVGTDGTVPWILNVALFGIAALAFFWVWLGKVWRQQIIEGQYLTTAARMVVVTGHVGVMLLGVATLVSIKLTLWPLMPRVADWDFTIARMVAGPLAVAMLAVVAGWIAQQTNRINLGYLTLLNVACLVGLVVVRVPGLLYHRFVPHWPVWIMGWCIIMAMVSLIRPNASVAPVAKAAKIIAVVFCPAMLLTAAWVGPADWRLASLVAVGLIYVVYILAGMLSRLKYARSSSAIKSQRR